MFFGIKEKRIEMGIFNSDKCEKCGKGQEYKFIKITKFFVAFFINLIPLSSSYEYICEECGITESVDKDAGKILTSKKFGNIQGKLITQTVLKILAFLVVIAAAVVLPLLLIKPSFSNPAVLKDLVSDDGVYSIQNEEGEIHAIVEIIDGEKNLVFFDDVSILTGEDGATGSFIIHEHYQEVSGDKQVYEGASLTIGETKLERIPGDVGMLTDKHDTPVRSYYYDIAKESLGYAMGIADLTTIEYAADKATYFYDYHLSEEETKSYAVVLLLSDTQTITATFMPMLTGESYGQLASLNISDMENGKITTQSVYELDEETIAASYDSGISISSTPEEINSFVEDNAVEPIYIAGYKYFKNTKVIKTIKISMPDELGVMQTVPQSFEVTIKNGYYIQQEQLD